jgi:hypothetical protein
MSGECWSEELNKMVSTGNSSSKSRAALLSAGVKKCEMMLGLFQLSCVGLLLPFLLLFKNKKK